MPINLLDPTLMAARLAQIDGTGLSDPTTSYEATTNAAIKGVRRDVENLVNVFESEASVQTQWIQVLYTLVLSLQGLSPAAMPLPNFEVSPPQNFANQLLSAAAATKIPPSA